MNNSEEIDDQMSNIIDDINDSIYKYAEVNEMEVIISDYFHLIYLCIFVY